MYDCVPYLYVTAIESLSKDSVTFCQNKSELAKSLTEVFKEKGFFESGDEFSERLSVEETLGETCSDETVEEIFETLREFSEKSGLILIANYNFSGIAPDGLSFVYHPEVFFKGKRLIGDVDDWDYSRSYVNVDTDGDCYRIDLEEADEDIADEYYNNDSEYWEQFSDEQMKEKGFLTPNDCNDAVCESLFPLLEDALTEDDEEAIALCDSVKESLKKAF